MTSLIVQGGNATEVGEFFANGNLLQLVLELRETAEIVSSALHKGYIRGTVSTEGARGRFSSLAQPFDEALRTLNIALKLPPVCIDSVLSERDYAEFQQDPQRAFKENRQIRYELLQRMERIIRAVMDMDSHYTHLREQYAGSQLAENVDEAIQQNYIDAMTKVRESLKFLEPQLSRNDPSFRTRDFFAAKP